MSSFFNVLLQTTMNAAIAGASASSSSGKKGKKKGSKCTPCAANARAMDARHRAGLDPTGGR